MDARTLRKCAWLTLFITCLGVPDSLGAQGAVDSARVARLAALGRIWNAVRFLHPVVAYDTVDWDAALVASIPRVSAARSTGEYAAAVQSMLAELADPATRVAGEMPTGALSLSAPHPTWRWTDDRVLLVSITNYADLEDFPGALARLNAVAPRVDSAQAVIFDMRRLVTSQGAITGLMDYYFGNTIAGRLAGERLVPPPRRGRLYSGYPREDVGSWEYFAGWRTLDGRTVEPEPRAVSRPIVFIVNDGTELPEVALALIDAGRAGVVATGSTSAIGATVARLPAGEGLTVELRLTERLFSDGSRALRPDTIVIGSDAVGVAIARVRAGRAVRSATEFETLTAQSLPPRAYPDMQYPSHPYRLLAAFRIWGVFEYFNPYRELIESEWEGVLESFIPRFEEARDSLEYAQAVAAMVSRTHDSHVTVRSAALTAWQGDAPLPVQRRWIDQKVVVTRLTDPAAERAGFRVGDVITSIDGVPVDSLIARFTPYVAASTPQQQMWSVTQRLGRGAHGSVASVSVERGDGRLLDLSIRRETTFIQGFVSQREGEVLRFLPGNVGYADLDRLPVTMVDSMFSLFDDTEGIIFDVRGYPLGTAWQIAPRLTDHSPVPAALFRRRVVAEPRGALGEIEAELLYEFTQYLPPPRPPTYRGRTVMLIDERTQSQAEHTGLFFEVANGTTFVGTPTSGTNGDITSFVLPGDIGVTFTGQGVRHADGRQLQRVGLQPHVLVAPTIEGIRAGRDEVLEGALAYLGGANQ